MAQPYVGEIRMFAGNFFPAGWMFCDGRPLQIAEYETLFQLIGTTYGGDGQSTFNVPDLRGRVPRHMPVAQEIAFTGGVESVTLTVQQIPIHSHPLLGTGMNGAQATPAGNLLASSTVMTPYASFEPVSVTMAPASISPVGGSQPHDNMQPYLCITFIISLFGIFPSPS
jgi:microcystin-dependent protein